MHIYSICFCFNGDHYIYPYIVVVVRMDTIRAVCPNLEVVVFQPQTGTTLYLSYVAIFTTILDYSRPTYFNYVLDISFSPQDLTPINPLYSTCWRRFDLLLHPLLPPQLARVRSDRPPGRRPHPSASAVRLTFSPYPGGHKKFLARACVYRSSSGFPPFAVLDLRLGPCQPQG